MEDGTVQELSRERPPQGAKRVKTITYDQYHDEKRSGSNKSRLCGDLTRLIYHKSKLVAERKGRNCSYCGEAGAYYQCQACPDRPWVHAGGHHGTNKDKYCFYLRHDTSRYGLNRTDMPKCGLKLKDWKPPSDKTVSQNRKRMQGFEQQWYQEVRK